MDTEEKLELVKQALLLALAITLFTLWYFLKD